MVYGINSRQISISQPAICRTDISTFRNEEVVALVGGHFAGLKGKVPRVELPNLVPTLTGSQGIEGKRKKDMKTKGHWAFEDDNISAHLIRNALGGGDESNLREMLSIPAPYSRRYRDDVTVTVVWWEEGNENGAKVASIINKQGQNF